MFVQCPGSFTGASRTLLTLAEGEADLARAFIEGRIEPVNEQAADLTARIWNANGRKRQHATATLIAACAISARAEFVTANIKDFRPPTAYGLRLAGM